MNIIKKCPHCGWTNWGFLSVCGRCRKHLWSNEDESDESLAPGKKPIRIPHPPLAAPLTATCSHCGARIRAPEEAAGRKAKCPKCRAQIMVPKRRSDAPSASPLTPRDNTPTVPISPHYPAPQPHSVDRPSDSSEVEPVDESSGQLVDRGELTDIRCYDCGHRIYEKELVRRDALIKLSINQSTSLGTSIGHVKDGHTWGQIGSASSVGTQTQYQRVNLCAVCNRSRNEAEEAARILEEEAKAAEKAKKEKLDEDMKKVATGCGAGCLAVILIGLIASMVQSCMEEKPHPRWDNGKTQQIIPARQAMFNHQSPSSAHP